MILLDSNLFIVDRFFPRDALYPQNRAFVDRLAELEAAISVFTLIEICGVASFNLSARELEHWLYQFPAVYPVLVLDPFDLEGQSAADWVKTFLAEVSANIAQKMTFGDALILREAENYRVEAIITWNTKDFLQRTRLPILTPTSYLDAP
jgi:predicted nucleic acid-binding protein